MTNNLLIIQEITHNESAAWDAYVEGHKNHTPYHSFSWLAAVEDAYRHKTHYLVAKQSEEIVGILPVVKIQVPLKGNSLCSLPFCDVGGCLVNNEEIQAALESKASSLKLAHNSRSIEYRERTDISDTAQLEHEKVSMLLPLPEHSEALFSGFKSKLRSQIRKAEKNQLTFELGKSQQFIDDFYAVFNENMHRLGSPVHSKKWIEAVCKAYQQNCIISVVKLEDKPVAAGIVLFTAQKACIPWASTRAEFNRLSPNMMLYWSLLKFSTDNGCTEFDFGRSTFNEGTYRFKQQWGAVPTLLKWRNDSHVTTPSSAIPSNSKIKQLVEMTWTKLPLSVANFIGPKIRRYISL